MEKGFFSPIEEGHYKGLTFGDWFFTKFQTFGVGLVILIAIHILTALKYTFVGDEIVWFWILLCFGLFILGIWAFKTLQKWQDLKTGKTR